MNRVPSMLRVLAAKDLRQNILTYLVPLPLFLALHAYRLLQGGPLRLNPDLSMALLAAAAVVAVVYGWQGFSGEADRKTLDFLLSRPISPAALIAVKYLLNMGIYTVWLLLFAADLGPDLSALPLPAGTAGGWVVLALLVLLGMSYLSGLLVNGTERLLVTAVLSTLLAGLSYLIWLRALDLVAARYYWPDVPPHVLALICRTLPLFLLLCALSVPPVFALWQLKGRRKPWLYRPLRRLACLWAGLFLLVEAGRAALGPAIWPVQNLSLLGGACGDWHLRSGIVLAGTPARSEPFLPYLLRTRGGRARPVYRGLRVCSPRWSPDGRAIAFTDDGWVMVLRGRSVKRLVRGENPFWSRDGRRLAYSARTPGRTKTTRISLVDLGTGRTWILRRQDGDALGFAWDSVRQRLYLFDRDNALLDMDLKTGKTLRIEIPTRVKLVMQNPWGVLGPEGRLYLSLCSERELRVYVHPPGTKELAEIERFAGHLLSVSQGVVSPDGKGLLWPRLDGAYEYLGFLPAEEDTGHEHIHAHGEL